MSRLNASIKLAVIIGEAFFLLLSIVITALSALVISGRVNALNIPSIQQSAVLILATAVAMCVCVVCGCCGAVNQVSRQGCCSGRRLLSFHQLALVAVFIVSFTEIDKLSLREKSIELVINNAEAYPIYDAFEGRLKGYFNGMYFDSICIISDSSSKWVQNWVDQQCPDVTNISPDICNSSRKYSLDDCDLSCLEEAEEAEDKGKCCLNIYNECRVPILEKVNSMIQSLARLIQLIACLSGTMIIFTCLLICYNPRDNIEMELLKTGVMTQDDLETIQKLKSETFPYEKGNEGMYKINLDKLHQTSDVFSGTSHLSQRQNRKRIYPHNLNSAKV
jgi:hypothetical protein